MAWDDLAGELEEVFAGLAQPAWDVVAATSWCEDARERRREAEADYRARRRPAAKTCAQPGCSAPRPAGKGWRYCHEHCDARNKVARARDGMRAHRARAAERKRRQRASA